MASTSIAVQLLAFINFASASPRNPRSRVKNGSVKRKTVVAVAMLVLAGLMALIAHSRSGAAAPKYVTAPVAYGDVASNVQETGTVNPVTVVDVGTQVSGTVSKLFVDYNTRVRQGQVLATLDPTSFNAAGTQAQGALGAAQANAAAQASAVDQAGANVAAAQATLKQMEANIETAHANIGKAQSQLALDQTTLARDQALLGAGYIAQSQVDSDTNAVTADRQALRAAKAALGVARAQHVASASQYQAAQAQQRASAHQAAASRSQILSAQGQFEQAQYNLSRATITSPIDGIVVSRGVSVGQTVAASFQTPTLFVIASNLKDMQIDVSVDEADVGNLRAGDPASITVPAFPNVIFRGTVRQVRVNPTVTQGVVTYDAVVVVHDERQRLLPGMTASVSIAVASAKHVLIVPTAALLYRESGATPAPLAGAPGSRVALTLLRAGRPVRVPVTIGLSDGEHVQIASGHVAAGDSVIVAALQSNRPRATSPFGGTRGR
ncbi:efflux RND transporter periplasmic adaptor subunit [bacterium]|nr:MAG: efflux RND transporter periplasmic adaptor subunit [bacterium]